MEIRRAIAVLIALFAAILIMAAGRSCAKNISEQNKKADQSEYQDIKYHQTGYVDNGGVNSGGNAAPSARSAEETSESSEQQIQEITNLLGEVVGTEVVTDPLNDGEIPEETGPTKSILEQYNEAHGEKPNYSGGGVLHNQDGERVQEEQTEKVTVKPADEKDIILNVG